MGKTFRPYDLSQLLLLPPDMRQWLRPDHLALYVSDIVEQLDLSAILNSYEEGRGQPPYHPQMMVKLLIYGYCVGKMSSRKLEEATYDDVAFRVLSANQQPDHASIAEFRKRHLAALAQLFVQVLQLCERAGLVKLGHVAIDGSKIKANASKYRSMTYAGLSEAEQKLVAEVTRLLAEAERIDAAEDELYGKDKRGDELPAELRDRESRLRRIRELKADLEREAREAAEQQAAAAKQKNEERLRKAKERGQKPGRLTAVPDPEQAVLAARQQAWVRGGTGSPGSFTFRDLEPGTWVVGLLDSQRSRVFAHAVVEVADGFAERDLVLRDPEPGEYLEILVEDPEGSPLDDVMFQTGARRGPAELRCRHERDFVRTAARADLQADAAYAADIRGRRVASTPGPLAQLPSRSSSARRDASGQPRAPLGRRRRAARPRRCLLAWPRSRAPAAHPPALWRGRSPRTTSGNAPPVRGRPGLPPR